MNERVKVQFRTLDFVRLWAKVFTVDRERSPTAAVVELVGPTDTR